MNMVEKHNLRIVNLEDKISNTYIKGLEATIDYTICNKTFWKNIASSEVDEEEKCR